MLHCWWECKLLHPSWKSIWHFLRKLGIVPPQNPATLVLDKYPKDVPASHKDPCSIVFIAALFIIARNWTKLTCPSDEKQIRKMWSIYTLEYYSGLKKQDTMNVEGNEWKLRMSS